MTISYMKTLHVDSSTQTCRRTAMTTPMHLSDTEYILQSKTAQAAAPKIADREQRWHQQLNMARHELTGEEKKLSVQDDSRDTSHIQDHQYIIFILIVNSN